MKYDLSKRDFVDCEVKINKLALAGSDKDLSWQELRDEVEKAKDKILSYNLPKGHPVIIYGHKEANFIVNIIACLSLRLPYIPLDTVYPMQRVQKISTILKSSLILNTNDDTIQFNEDFQNTTYEREDEIVYIIFTSGSTGEPKGVQITEESVKSFANWLETDFNFNSENVYMNQVPMSFDVSVFGLLGMLLFEGTFVLNSKKLAEDHQGFQERIKKYQCNTWISTPSFINSYLFSESFNEVDQPYLKEFIFAGENLTSPIVKKVLNKFPNSKVFNSYGPTEATVTVTLIQITSEILEKYKAPLPIGYVKSDTNITLLDKNEEGIGEIQITGDSVSIGYFNADKLNQEKFLISNGVRSFNTGDYGYFEGDILFFLNRKDDLVKLHGYRIQLEEIDKNILDNPNIKNALTIPLKRRGETTKLICFIIADKIVISELVEKLHESLPYYMVPAEIIAIDKFPLNANQKIDKAELIKIYQSNR